MNAAAVSLMLAVVSGLLPVDFHLGPLVFRHWMSIAGAFLLGILIPVYSVLKRRRPQSIKRLLAMHVYGNLFSFQLISVHFIAHYMRGYDPVLDTGTGFLLFVIITMLVITGMLRRFQIASRWTQTWKFMHLSLTVSLYLIAARHVLRALRIF